MQEGEAWQGLDRLRSIGTDDDLRWGGKPFGLQRKIVEPGTRERVLEALPLGWSETVGRDDEDIGGIGGISGIFHGILLSS